MKVVIHHDGKKYLEMEIAEYDFLDKIDNSEFARPGSREVTRVRRAEKRGRRAP